MNNMIEDPIPPPSGKRCVNCGQYLANEASFCPHCGASQLSKSSGFVSAVRVIGIVILAGLTLLFGAAGACFMVFAGSGSLSPGSISSDTLGLGVVGLVLLGIAGLCVWGAIALAKRR